MLKIVVLFVAAFTLAACGPFPPIVERKDPNLFVEKILDMGMVDGCRVKYVVTTIHPNFYIIKCDDRLISTMYQTGGKNPVYAPILAVE